jgi:hypothetical protein
VLDISKALMYDYHYNVMQRHTQMKICLKFYKCWRVVLLSMPVVFENTYEFFSNFYHVKISFSRPQKTNDG